MLEKFLQKFGLSHKESQVYLSMLGIGSNAVSVIARKSGLTRTTVYSVLESLNNKGLVRYFEKNKLRYYIAERPEIIFSMLDKRIRETNIQRHQFEELLPEFRSMMNSQVATPSVRYFEGLEGIKEIYEDTLKDMKDKLAFSGAPEVKNKAFRLWLKEYASRRASLGITARAIFADTKQSRAYVKEDKSLLRESYLVPADKFPFRSEINIYANKVAIMSLEEGLYHGVIIESEPIAETQRAIFELAWMGAASANG